MIRCRCRAEGFNAGLQNVRIQGFSTSQPSSAESARNPCENKVLPMAPSLESQAITAEVIADHGLTAEEYQKVLKLLGREPTLTELGIFSVMWSEHCSYKSSKVHLKRLPTRSKLVVQGPGENAGVIDIGEGWVCAFKIESHKIGRASCRERV